MPKTQAPDYYFKTGDTYSPLEAVLKDADSNPVDISAATAVTFSMRPVGSTTNTINAAAATNLDDGSSANRGRVRYIWEASDVLNTGDFYGEFTVTFSGADETFPRGLKEYLLIRGQERLS